MQVWSVARDRSFNGGHHVNGMIEASAVSGPLLEA